MAQVTVVTHPLVQHKLALLRRTETAVPAFRRTMRDIGLLLAYEAMRDAPLAPVRIDTPLEPMDAPMLPGLPPCFVPILRAGAGLVDGMLDLVPTACVGHVGLYRDPVTLLPVEYYLKLPDRLTDRLVVVVDPMLATGQSAAAALTRLRQAGAAAMRFVCLLAAPEGLAALQQAHPDIPITTAAIDRALDAHGYIRPGLGDAGDRLYGT